MIQRRDDFSWEEMIMAYLGYIKKILISGKRIFLKLVWFGFIITFGGAWLLMSKPSLSLAKLTDKDIERLRQEIIAKGHPFTVGINSATNRSIRELCGVIIPLDWQKMAKFQQVQPNEIELSSSFNWCTNGGCTPVRDQDRCGSCWAFATISPLESAIKIHEGKEVDLSEQYLVSCVRDSDGCSGGWIAHDYHLSIFYPPETEAGAVPEDDFPYSAMDEPCSGPYSHPYKIKSWAYIGKGGEYTIPTILEYTIPTILEMKQAIKEYGPVTVIVSVDDAFQAYTGGIFVGKCICSITELNHAVVITGWQDDLTVPGGGYWYVRNSWGTGWGENGYMRIAYICNNGLGYGANFIVYE